MQSSIKSTDIIINLFKSLTSDQRLELLPFLSNICEEDIEKEKVILRNKAAMVHKASKKISNISSSPEEKILSFDLPVTTRNGIKNLRQETAKLEEELAREIANQQAILKYQQEARETIRQEIDCIMAKWEKIMDFSLMPSDLKNDQDKTHADEAEKYIRTINDFCVFRKPYKFVIISNGAGIYSKGDMPQIKLLDDIADFRCAYFVSDDFHNKKLSENLEAWSPNY